MSEFAIVVRSCRECPYMWKIVGACKEIQGEPSIEDPDVIPAWCPKLASSNQLAAYRALLVEAHELLIEWDIGWPGTRHVADLLTRIEAVVG